MKKGNGIQAKLPYRYREVERARVEGVEKERHFGKLVSVCGDVFKSSGACGTRRATSFRKKARSFTASFGTSPPSAMPPPRRLLVGKLLLYFSPAHFVSLTAFISQRFAHERTPLSISFHFTAAVSAVKTPRRKRSRRNAGHSSRKNRPTSPNDRRLFEFLRLEAIFEDVDENRSCLQIARDNQMAVPFSFNFSLRYKLLSSSNL